ncbi:MAG: 4-hydroxybenzoate octaprenyltransferase [Alphaproteobacteria bacterium]
MSHSEPPRTEARRNAPRRPADALARSWVDRWLPAWAVPFARLARLDRPIGAWLLMWPCWWAVALSAATQRTTGLAWPAMLLALFALGAVAMRGAGCTYNDLIDRDIDKQVARTRDRPLPSGQVGPAAAVGFVILQSLVGLAVLLAVSGGTMWSFTFGLGLASLAPVAIYPFMKRITHWPQLFLGLAFNWGALVGWAAVTGGVELPAILLYGAGVAWTLGYDTIYAHQDTSDDAIIGVKSTALKFAGTSHRWIAGFYGAAVLFWFSAALAAGAPWVTLGVLGGAGVHLAWQIVRLDIARPEICLTMFRANRTTGLIVFAAFLAGVVWPAG